jgi:pimeloyl-ACP methyl ester carboxylesterase
VPVEELVLLGHSMGGLVARNACLVGERAGHRWFASLRKLICLGAPHHGAPLERGGNQLERAFAITRYSAPLARLGRIRSAGVTDLRHGNVLDDHWVGLDRFASGEDLRCPMPLPEGVACYAIAGSADRMVPVDSALGRHARADLTLAFPPDHQRIVAGANHLDLLDHPEVWAQLQAWLAPA